MRTTEELFAQVGVHHATSACLGYRQDQGREYFRQKRRRLAKAGLLVRVGLRWQLGPMAGGPTGQRELFQVAREGLEGLRGRTKHDPAPH
jgi:hypothetical protein